ATIAGGFLRGLLDAGITPTAKHGLRWIRTCSAPRSMPLSLNLRLRTGWPFQAVLSVRGVAIMLSHVALTAADTGISVSRSKRVVSGLLRDQWGFDGVAITDDLTMGAVEHAGLCRAVEGALNAGIDLLLVSWDTDKAYPALRFALDALAAGRLNRQMLERSAARLDRLAAAKPGSNDGNSAAAH
ncbi:MAG TPA: glycoside hydrolase family 3 N-terminal domain-containing protein, partial [Acetobacteraceae bacterium]|nr:glycoside hydrolase family 3 N-terminal domain-containing protein [Acetobacteraceae bacterium]